MADFRDRYVNPFTDFGFKKLFGEEPNKDLLIDFLNALLNDVKGKIINITYLKTEQLAPLEDNRKAVFDLYCENERGEKFIVELQKTKQNFFKDRTVYYSTFPFAQQAKVSNWNFELKAVYMIAILDFVFKDSSDETGKFRHDVMLSEITTQEVFYDKLTFIYLEMPKFTKTVDELESRFDKWMYVIKNLNRLDRVPEKLRETIFEKLFTAAEIAKFTQEDLMWYEESLKHYRDLQNSLDAKWDDAISWKAQQMAIIMLQDNEDVNKIMKYTGLILEEITKLKTNNKI